MKAYQIMIEFVDLDPKVWRRVIMPADATFNKLHVVIQHVTNFKSWYVDSPYHLFEFDLEKENIRVTNDDNAYEEHKHFMQNRQKYWNNLKTMNPEFRKFEERRQELLSKVVRKPTRLKIDNYLESYGEIDYQYDFGDDWRILVTLEKVVNDHLYGYPILVDGAGTAPPEDVGGVPGFQMFLESYYNPDAPDHAEIRKWGEEQLFREYDKEWTNSILKHVKYKKTEWDKINEK